MGYYSFYKIIKDIFRTIFGKKFFRLLLIFIIIAFVYYALFIPKSKASFDIAYNSNSYILPDLPSDLPFDDYFISFRVLNSNNSVQDIYLISVDKPENLAFENTSLNTSGFHTSVIAVSEVNYKRYFINGNSWYGFSTSHVDGGMNSSGKYKPIDGCQYDSQTYSIVYSTFDIKDINGTVVHSNDSIKLPQITTPVSDLETLDFDYICVDSWSYSNSDLYMLLYDRNTDGEEESLSQIYPKTELLLNKDSKYYNVSLTSAPDTNAIYWVSAEDIGFKLALGGNYSIRLAERVPVDPSENNGSAYYYHYLGDTVDFTVSANAPQERLDRLNSLIGDALDDLRHEQEMNAIQGTTNAINNQTQENAEFHNEIMSNTYDENQPSDTLSDTVSSTDSIDESQYTGLFSAIFGKFSNIISGNYSSVEETL